MPVLHWCVPRTFQPGLMLAHCPAGLNQGHCLASLTRTLTLRLLVPSAPNTHTHTQARKHSCRHTQGPFSTGTLGRGCHGDNRPTLIPSPSDSESERETEIKKWYYSKCGMCECAFPSHSWHSRRRWWNEARTIAPHTHTHIHNTLLMHPAPALGLKALHDLLNKRLEQQVKGGTVRSVTNVVLYVHTDV